MPNPGGWRTRLGCIGAVFGFAAVVLAALGSHAVKFGTPADAVTWRTALDLHMFHTAAMLAIAALAANNPAVALPRAGLMLGLGTLLFSGSLYLRAAGLQLLPTWIAPAGGLILMVAWAWLAVILVKRDSS